MKNKSQGTGVFSVLGRVFGQKNPWSFETRLNKKVLVGCLSAFVGGCVLVALIYPEKEQIFIAPGFVQQTNIAPTTSQLAPRPSQIDFIADGGELGITKADRTPPSLTEHSSEERPRRVSQIVEKRMPKTLNTANSGGLPTGTTFPALLVNAVSTSNGEAPVVAHIRDPVVFRGEIQIPMGSRLIGSAQMDPVRERMNMTFSKVVFQDGAEGSISAIAMSKDGSNGISGEFSSGRGSKALGRGISRFTQGLASGLKERQATQFGEPYEPGSVKNGLLNAITEAGEDQAQIYTQDMQAARPSLYIPAGTRILVFLQSKFSKE